MQKEELIQILLRHKPRLIAIDGLGASGKTTLARELASQLGGGVRIIHTDDYYKPVDQRTSGLIPEIVSPDFDWDRFEREVFHGSRQETTFVVGVYVLQERFASRYDFRIWMDVPQAVRIQRMIEREGIVVARDWQEKWLAREERYLVIDRPDQRADAIFTILANSSG